MSKKLLTDFDEILRRAGVWPRDQLITFWQRSASLSGSGSPFLIMIWIRKELPHCQHTQNRCPHCSANEFNFGDDPDHRQDPGVRSPKSGFTGLSIMLAFGGGLRCLSTSSYCCILCSCLPWSWTKTKGSNSIVPAAARAESEASDYRYVKSSPWNGPVVNIKRYLSGFWKTLFFKKPNPGGFSGVFIGFYWVLGFIGFLDAQCQRL